MNEDGDPRDPREQRRHDGWNDSRERMPSESVLRETMRVLRLWQAELGRLFAAQRGQEQPDSVPAVPGPRHGGVGYGRRRLYRSRDERMVRGVCGGLADYTGLPVALVRLFFVLLFFTGPWHALIPYVLLSVLVAEEPRAQYAEYV